MKLFQAGAHWSGRKESAEACARRVAVLFQELGRCDPAYARWFEYSYSRRRSLEHPFEPTVETFLGFFKRRKYRLGTDGFTFDAWTGEEQRGRGGIMHFVCGVNSSFYTNECLLYLPREEPAASRVLTVPVLKEVVRALVRAWEPDGCVVFPDADRASRKALDEAIPSLGWLTYISSERGSVPPLPKPVRVEPMEDKGSLILLTPECFSLKNPEHVALAGSVRERLEKAGLLPPPKS